MVSNDFDVLVVGSGFGGSVSALRLTEKGYRAGVIEAGRRFDTDTLPKTSWNRRKFLWAPRTGATNTLDRNSVHLAERAMSLWPNKGEPDARLAVDDPYVRLAPVTPRTPAVPADGPGALRVGSGS